MNSSLLARASALVLGLASLPLGLIWAYWIALFALALGVAGLLLLRFAERRAPRHAVARAERRLHVIARDVIWLSFAASATMLVAILARG
jgi:hypothetical protein